LVARSDLRSGRSLISLVRHGDRADACERVYSELLNDGTLASYRQWAFV